MKNCENFNYAFIRYLTRCGVCSATVRGGLQCFRLTGRENYVGVHCPVCGHILSIGLSELKLIEGSNELIAEYTEKMEDKDPKKD